MTNATKLQTLTEIEGFDEPIELFEANSIDSVVPGICMNPGCDYSCGIEPDSTEGWCDECGTNSVMSCIELFFDVGDCDE